MSKRRLAVLIRSFFNIGVAANSTDSNRLIYPTKATHVFNESNPLMTEKTKAKKGFVRIFR